MKVSEFISLAKASVLKQLQLDDADILAFINLAVLQVYKRFPINEREQLVQLKEFHNFYELNDDFMSLVSAFTPQKYLKDDEGILIGFTDDKIVSIGANDDNDPNSFHTPTPGRGMVNYPSEGQPITLIYRAGIKEIQSDELEEELKITQQYIEPLLMYLGYLGYMSINSTTGVGDGFLTKYNISCASLQKNGVANMDSNSNIKLHMRGFV